MKIDKIKVAVDTFYLFCRAVLIKIIGIPVQILVARLLGPADFGLLKIINYIPTLAKYCNLGFTTVAVREILHMRGKKKKHNEEERKLRNISFSCDLIWIGVLTVIVFVSAFYYTGTIRWGICIASAALFMNQVRRMYHTKVKIEKDFKRIARASLIGYAASAVWILSTVWFMRIYSVLLAAVIEQLVTALYLRRHAPLDFTFCVEQDETFRQAKIAIPLTLGSLSYGLYGWVQRLFVAQCFGLTVLGVYMFGITIIESTMLLVNNAMQAFGVHLYESLGAEDENDEERESLVKDPTFTFSIGAVFIGFMAIIVCPWLFKSLLPQYSELNNVLILIVLIVYFMVLSAVYMTSLVTAKVNKQVDLILFRIISIGVFCCTIVIFGHQGIIAPFLASLLSAVFLYAASSWSVYKFFHKNIMNYLWQNIQYSYPLLWSLLYWLIIRNRTIDSFEHTMLTISGYAVWYAPMIWYWEKKVGLIKEIRGKVKSYKEFYGL